MINMTDPDVQVDAVKELTGSYDELIRNYRFNDELIRNYRFNDDVFGSLGYRLGETYDISKEGNIELDEGLDNKLNLNALSGSHTISNFTTGYDSKTREKLDTPIPKLYREDGNIWPR